jgi:hypothetical protein
LEQVREDSQSSSVGKEPVISELRS